jgi:ketosteroid isomerase-like protein
MEAKSPSIEQDEKVLVSIVEEMSKSMTGVQSTKDWANDVLWFDIPPFASRGVEPARAQFDKEFGKLSSFVVEIIERETFIHGDMGIVCSVQRWNIVPKDGSAPSHLLVRQTDCFERREGQWRIIHEHSSLPAFPGWDGKIETRA